MRATLNREKKYELAFAALTHKFVGERGRDASILVFRPKNDLKLESFYGKTYFTEANAYKNKQTNLENAENLERNLVNPASINQLTATNKGKDFASDYYQASEEQQFATGSVFESRMNAFRDQVLIMYTLKAQKDLFTAFTDNILELQQASVLDKKFVNEIVKDLFPEQSWTVESAKQNLQKEEKVLSSQPENVA